MADTKITLNGKDWSNLIIVDYPGGAGGELLSAKIAKDTNAVNFTPKSKHSTSVVDSAGNEFSSSGFSELAKSLYRIKDPSYIGVRDAKTLQQIMKFSIVMWDHHQRLRNLNLHIFDKNHPIGHWPWGLLFQHFIEYFEINIDTDIIPFTNNVVVRLHYNELETEEHLPGSKRVRLYPVTEHEAFATAVRMCAVKWLDLKKPENDITSDGDYITKWPQWLQIAFKKQSGHLFEWQIDSYKKGRNDLTTFEDFYDDYVLKNKRIDKDRATKYDNLISSVSWTDRGLNEIEQEKYSDIVGVRYTDTPELQLWRTKNNNVFADVLGADINTDSEDMLRRKVMKRENKLCIQLKS